MQEIKIGQYVLVRAEVRRIIEDKDGKQYEVKPEGMDTGVNTMIIGPKYIVE